MHFMGNLRLKACQEISIISAPSLEFPAYYAINAHGPIQILTSELSRGILKPHF